MYYEINVAQRNKNGDYHHFFATTKRSAWDKRSVATLLKALVAAFPKPEYEISVTRWEEQGYGEDIQKLLAYLNPESGISVSNLKPGFYIFGNRGNVSSNNCHIAKSGASTLCGTPMLSFNHAKAQDIDVIGCPKCIEKYKKG